MDTDSIPRSILIILALIIVSGFFAAAETAFANCSRIRLKAWSDDGRKSASRALTVLEKFDKAIITLLIGNNVAHVLATSSATVLSIFLAVRAWGEKTGQALGPVLATVILTLIIFIFGETIPKNIAKERCDEMACAFSGILHLLMILFTPLDIIFMSLGAALKRLFHTEEGPAITEDDFQTMIETIEDEGGLEADESELIQSAVEFTDRTVLEILTPRVHMVGLDLHDEEDTIVRKIMEEKYSRLPVYEGDMDHIVGILNTKVYLQKRIANRAELPDIRKMMVPPFVIDEHMGMYELVDEMRRRKMHIAIVKDAWGGTLGMVTMEDLLEELVGEIWDEDEKKEASA